MGPPKVVREKAFISQMEIALYTVTVKVVCKKQDIWDKIVRLVLQHSPPKLKKLYQIMLIYEGVYGKTNGFKVLHMLQKIFHLATVVWNIEKI